MRKLLLLLFWPTLLTAQYPWSNILSSSRAIDWSKAGLPAIFPDGESTTNPWTPPTRRQCGPTLTPSGGDDTTQILNAFNGSGSFSSCTPPYAVVLGAGSFQIQNNLFLGGNSTRNNITLRGGGPRSTTVTATNSNVTIQTGSCCIGGGSGAFTSASSNYTKGQTTFLLQNVTASPFVGAVAHIHQCDDGFTNSSPGTPLGSGSCTGSASDPLTVFHCSDTICTYNGNSDSTRQQEVQTVRVTSATNTGGSNWTVTVTPDLYMSDYTYAKGTTLTWDNNSSYTSVGIGFEDMTIRVYDGAAPLSIGNGGYASWVKGVRLFGYNDNRIISVSLCSHCLVVNNYFFANDPFRIGVSGTIMHDDYSSDTMFLNNIAQFGTISDDGGRHQGYVFAYNYSRDSSDGGDYQATLFEHTPGTLLMLREGNQLGRINDDDTWGTHNFDTDFRQNFNCADAPYDLGTTVGGGLQVGPFSRFENAIGNAIGFGQPSYPTPKCPSYQGAATDGYVFNVNGGTSTDTSGLTTSSLMRWGNVSTDTQSTDTPANSGIRFVSSEVPSNLSSFPNAVPYQVSVPGNNNLPCTFFLQGYLSSTSCTPLYNGGTGFSWWKVCTSWTTFPTACASYKTPPFPANGPDILAANGAPANYANDIPAAVAWKNLPIDATMQTSYTVTGSSWSGGTETLTVQFPSGVNHPEGGIQLSGFPAMCTPSSGVSYTGRADGEIIVTASSNTSMSYALASNPNTTCTGTLKWPDFRQFDERVYQNDPSSTGTTVAAPTNLTATVQ